MEERESKRGNQETTIKKQVIQKRDGINNIRIIVHRKFNNHKIGRTQTHIQEKLNHNSQSTMFKI